VLGIRGINMLEGYVGQVSSESVVASFFLESSNPRLTSEWLKEFIESSVFVSDVMVKEGVEGFLFDSLNFPVAWNTGDRAVLVQADRLRAMLDAVMTAEPASGAQFIYSQGFNCGKSVWEQLMTVHRPETEEGLSEVLQLYSAAGWGRPKLIHVDVKKMQAKVRFEELFECVTRRTSGSASHFIRGHLAGALSAYFQSDLRCEETKCISKGDKYCEFEVARME
jgi:predicted hydrocarbon binding protein